MLSTLTEHILGSMGDAKAASFRNILAADIHKIIDTLIDHTSNTLAAESFVLAVLLRRRLASPRYGITNTFR